MKNKISLIILCCVLPFYRCYNALNVPSGRVIPVTKENLNRYDLEKENFEQFKTVSCYLSNDLLLKKKSDTSIPYFERDNVIFQDDRRDSVLRIPSSYSAKVMKTFFRNKEKLFGLITDKKKCISIEFDGFEGISLTFIENESGYFDLEKDDRGRVSLGGEKYVCLDGCNNLLMVDAGEIDTYEGVQTTLAQKPKGGGIDVVVLLMVAAVGYLLYTVVSF